MSKFSLSIFLNAYSDKHPSNNPGMNNFRWERDLRSIIVNNPTNQANAVAPGQTLTFFNGQRTLAQDVTTQYSIALKPLNSSTYVLSWTGGTAPNFRTPRTTGADATTQVTVAVNGPVVTFTSTGGTPFNLTGGGCVVGDYVTIGNVFNSLNQGTFQIISISATSLTVAVLTGTNEGPITLGDPAQIAVFSAAGVQINDVLNISGGFSPASFGNYTVTAVYAESLEFSSTKVLPQESNILTESITIYSNSKQLVYIESDSPVNVIVNGTDVGSIEPFVIPNASQPELPPTVIPGMFMLKSTVYSLSVQNTGLNSANVYMAAIE